MPIQFGLESGGNPEMGVNTPDSATADTQRDSSDQIASSEEEGINCESDSDYLDWLRYAVVSDSDQAGFNRNGAGSVPVSIQQRIDNECGRS